MFKLRTETQINKKSSTIWLDSNNILIWENVDQNLTKLINPKFLSPPNRARK